MTNLRGTLLENESLDRYNSWRTGGIAKQVYKPQDVDDLANFLKSLPAGEPLLWLGLGSNTLIRDGGYAGTVIVTQGVLNTIEKVSADTIYAQAGVACAVLARFSARQNLTGIEFLAGIPGTIGGALRMNAGCFGTETWENVEKVIMIDSQGERHERFANEFTINYREVNGFSGQWFIGGYFKLQSGDKQQSLEKIRDLLARRSDTQPTGEHSCGSVFRNPEGDYAGRLIEACGLKGYRIGGAYVSKKHGNFIINDGSARSADIENLIHYVQDKIFSEHGIRLHQEVHIIGEKV